MNNYLEATFFMDFNDPTIQEQLNSMDLDGLSDKEKAVKLFYFVRDGSKYSVKGISLEPASFKSSYIIQKKNSYCIPKAVLLCSLARAAGIPARLHFVDFINHRLSEGLTELWGTNVMASHCFTELYIDGKWLKATPALDKVTCDTHNFKNVEFDGESDALLHSEDRLGNPHAEYINDHGHFEDLPLKEILAIFEKNYGHMSQYLIKQMFDADVSAFQ